MIFSEDLEKLFGKRKLSEHVIEEEDVKEKAEEAADTSLHTCTALLSSKPTVMPKRMARGRPVYIHIELGGANPWSSGQADVSSGLP